MRKNSKKVQKFLKYIMVMNQIQVKFINLMGGKITKYSTIIHHEFTVFYFVSPTSQYAYLSPMILFDLKKNIPKLL